MPPPDDEEIPVPDPDTWTGVVAAATRAPSIHNTQPWLFTPAGDRLEVRLDPRRALPVLDPTRRQQVISCGVAVEFAAVALRAAGHDVAVDVVPADGDPDHLATVRVTGDRAVQDADRALAAAIPARHTQRAAFADRAVPAEMLDRLQAAAGAYGVWLETVSRSDAELTAVALLSRAEEVEQREPAYRAELEQWLRAEPGAPDGIPVGAVPGEDPATRPSNWLIRDFLVGQRIAQVRPPVRDDDPPPLVERPAVVLMGTSGDDRYAWVQAGRALGRVLLEATAAGLAASPLTQALDWPATRARLTVQLSLVGHPQMLLRLGWPTVPAVATGRRPVAEVLRGAD
jgi:nitroreductase